MMEPGNASNHVELLGRELARQVALLNALQDERQVVMTGFREREQAIRREITRLALEIRSPQVPLYQPSEEGGR
jgi:hypothetical protein